MNALPPRLPTWERLRRAGIGAWSLIGLAIVLLMMAYLLLKIRVIFPPLVLATLIIYILNPLVTRLHDRGVSRIWGTLLGFVVFFGILTLVLITAIPFVSRQIEDFGDEVPRFKRQTIEFVDGTAQSIEERFGVQLDTSQIDCLLGADELEGIPAPTTARCDEVTRDLREDLVDRAGDFTSIGRSLLEILLVFVIGPLVALYLLIDLPQIQRDLLNLVPESHREEARDLGGKIGRAVGGFFRGQLFVAFFVGALSALGFWIIDLPFWFVIGAIAGFFNLVPLIGPFIGGGIGLVIGTISGGIGLGLQAALVEVIVQQIDNHLVSPMVMKKTVKLHPATVMLALLAGGTIAGFWGILLAVPGVAVTKILLSHLWATRVLQVEPSPHAQVAPTVVPDEPAGKPVAPEVTPEDS